MAVSSTRKAVIAALILLATIGAPRPYARRLPEEVPGNVSTGTNPEQCIGPYNLDTGARQSEQQCPPNTAFYGLDDPAGVAGPGARISVSGTCCPLPAKDILLDTVSYNAEHCPEASVATGVRRESNGEIFLQCTGINTNRYALRAPRSALYWGHGAAGWWGAEKIEWENIPPGIRSSQGQMLPGKYDVDGCIGYPWGSLFTGKESKYCSGMLFRQLVFKGTEGDPRADTPVRMFP